MATYSEDGQHLTLNELNTVTNNRYLRKDNIPTYPRPELHLYHGSHSTDLQGLKGIKADGGLKNPKDDQGEELKMTWFSLTVSPEELRAAEHSNMKLVHPGREEQEMRPRVAAENRAETDFLLKFASSPSFKSSSRYGSFRFTFSLEDIWKKYSEQFCDGQELVLRVYRTILYRQEVMYAVLVHSPKFNELFRKYPLLEETPDSICAFSAEPQPHFVWRPQAMSETHRFKLNVNEENISTEELFGTDVEFYVWDHVALALYVGDEILKFEDQELRENLRFCERDNPPVRTEIKYQTYEEADTEVNNLWPDHHLENFDKSQFHVTD